MEQTQFVNFQRFGPEQELRFDQWQKIRRWLVLGGSTLLCMLGRGQVLLAREQFALILHMFDFAGTNAIASINTNRHAAMTTICKALGACNLAFFLLLDFFIYF